MKRTVILQIRDANVTHVDYRAWDDTYGDEHEEGTVPVPPDDRLTRAIERMAEAAELGVMVREKWGWGTHYPQSDPGYHKRATEEAKEAIALVRAAAGLDEEQS